MNDDQNFQKVISADIIGCDEESPRSGLTPSPLQVQKRLTFNIYVGYRW